MYFQVVKRPMDLGTVRKKIDRGEYRTRAECLDEIDLVWSNAMLFNAPGHFVHENAKMLKAVAKEKLDKLERDEAAGIFDLPKPKPIKKPPQIDRDEYRPERRMVRKVSQDLPGENSQPQQLKKKYVENLSEQMKQCDSILKELMTTKRHEGYVNSFLHVNHTPDSMDLYKVQQRLQNHTYSHPLQFANDIRRLVSETYRYHQSRDPLVEKASQLQHNFEILFARVDYEPVPNPASFDSSADDDFYLTQLLTAQNQLITIQQNVTTLLNDLVRMKGVVSTSGGTKRKRGRPRGSVSSQPKKPREASEMALPNTGPVLSAEDSLALRQEVGELDEDHQQNIVQIMLDNGEKLLTDENGYTEIDLGICSAKTLGLIRRYIASVKSPAKAKGPNASLNTSASSVSTAATTPSPRKAKNPSPMKAKNGDGNLSDSSGDSSDESSSSDSSSGESDSE